MHNWLQIKVHPDVAKLPSAKYSSQECLKATTILAQIFKLVGDESVKAELFRYNTRDNLDGVPAQVLDVIYNVNHGFMNNVKVHVSVAKLMSMDKYAGKVAHSPNRSVIKRTHTEKELFVDLSWSMSLMKNGQ